MVEPDNGQRTMDVSGNPPVLSTTEESHASRCSREAQGWYHNLRAFLLALGSDVQLTPYARTTSFIRARPGAKVFAWINCRPKFGGIDIHIRKYPGSEPYGNFMVQLGDGGFRKDCWNVRIRSDEDVRRAKVVLDRSFKAD